MPCRMRHGSRHETGLAQEPRVGMPSQTKPCPSQTKPCPLKFHLVGGTQRTPCSANDKGMASRGLRGAAA
eukprot:1534332-Prymnesium_polylepis.1